MAYVAVIECWRSTERPKPTNAFTGDWWNEVVVVAVGVLGFVAVAVVVSVIVVVMDILVVAHIVAVGRDHIHMISHDLFLLLFLLRPHETLSLVVLRDAGGPKLLNKEQLRHGF